METNTEESRKIEETVLELLKTSNIEETTEFNIRLTASERLGIDLSGSEHRKFVRSVVENFLLSSMDKEEKEEHMVAIGNVDMVKHDKESAVVELQVKEVDRDGHAVICKLSKKRSIVVQPFKGESFVSIGGFYQKGGRQLPSNKGISLSTDQWSVFRKNIPAIEEAVRMMQSKLSPSVVDKEVSGTAITSVPRELHSTSVPQDSPATSVPQELATTSVSQEFIPVKINRFDGKNYHGWAEQMQLFLKQLNVVYVLSDPCPSVTGSADTSYQEIAKAKAAAQKWSNDDYICCHNILNSLSDSLFNQYSKKAMHAKELWEELKSVYLYEEFVTKRSQVKKYIEFEIVDGKPIVDQIHELNCIADSIVATGTPIDENFHVSAVISKLPPSWQDFSLKLMRVEALPFWMLMDWLKAEEHSRMRDQNGQFSSYLLFKNASNLGPRMRDTKRQGWQWKRRDTDLDNKNLVCHSCGKKGHIFKHCRNRSDKENHVEKNKQNPSTHTAMQADVQQN